MTVLIFKYNGENNKQTGLYKGTASKENYKEFLSQLQGWCKNFGLNKELTEKLELISEEIYTNIFSYAYPENNGDVEVTLTKENNVLTLVFKDNGIPYNPLERPDPDVTLPPESREQGGLGIFIVKSSVDEISYEYQDNSNILTMKIFL